MPGNGAHIQVSSRNINQSVHANKNDLRGLWTCDASHLRRNVLAPWLGWCFLSKTCWEQQRQRTKNRQSRMRKKFRILAWSGIASRVPNWRVATGMIRTEIPSSVGKVRTSEARTHFIFTSYAPMRRLCLDLRQSIRFVCLFSDHWASRQYNLQWTLYRSPHFLLRRILLSKLNKKC